MLKLIARFTWAAIFIVLIGTVLACELMVRYGIKF